MKSAANIGFWFLLAIIAIMFIALLAGIYYRLYLNKSRQCFIDWARNNFQARFPCLYGPAYAPRITLRSGCCGAFLWEAGTYKKRLFFCDKCGSECKKNGAKKEKGYNLNIMNEELASLAKFKSGE